MNVIWKWGARAMDTIHKVTQMPERYDGAAESYARSLAEETLAQVRDNILSGSITPGLSAATSASKRYKGLDPRVLVATEKYVGDMEAVPSGKKHSWGIKADPDRMRMLEFGTPNMPARPHMIPIARTKRRDMRLRMKFLKDMLGMGE